MNQRVSKGPSPQASQVPFGVRRADRDDRLEMSRRGRGNREADAWSLRSREPIVNDERINDFTDVKEVSRDLPGLTAGPQNDDASRCTGRMSRRRFGAHPLSCFKFGGTM